MTTPIMSQACTLAALQGLKQLALEVQTAISAFEAQLGITAGTVTEVTLTSRILAETYLPPAASQETPAVRHYRKAQTPEAEPRVGRKSRTKRTMSSEARAKISSAQQNRWSKARAAAEELPPAPPDADKIAGVRIAMELTERAQTLDDIIAS